VISAWRSHWRWASMGVASCASDSGPGPPRGIDSNFGEFRAAAEILQVVAHSRVCALVIERLTETIFEIGLLDKSAKAADARAKILAPAVKVQE